MTRNLDQRSLWDAVLADGRPLLLTGLALFLSGGFALFLAVTGQFLPHDIQFLGMSPDELCGYNQCRVVHFMVHDRASFGGVLLSIGVLYLWLAEFPLQQQQAWAWWLLLISGCQGFGSFLAYLGYGYLDTWHGMATALLLPCFVIGLIRARQMLQPIAPPKVLLRRGRLVPWRSPAGFGLLCLLGTAAGLVVAGLTITLIGMSVVFVPEDLAYMGLQPADLAAINPRLIPLIAHDRAGFGGGVCCSGLLVLGIVWCGPASRSQWQALALAGLAGFGPAIAVHPAIGYTDVLHLAPAVLGALMYGLGLTLTRSLRRGASSRPE